MMTVGIAIGVLAMTLINTMLMVLYGGRNKVNNELVNDLLIRKAVAAERIASALEVKQITEGDA